MNIKTLTPVIFAVALGFFSQACDKQYVSPSCNTNTVYVPADHCGNDNNDTYTADDGGYDNGNNDNGSGNSGGDGYDGGYDYGDDTGGCDSCGINHPLKRHEIRNKVVVSKSVK